VVDGQWNFLAKWLLVVVAEYHMGALSEPAIEVDNFIDFYVKFSYPAFQRVLRTVC